MQKIIESINHILAEWNPIDIKPEIAEEEYKSYIPLFLKFIDNKQRLEKCLENILVNKMRVTYDPSIKEHSKDNKSSQN